MTAPRWDWTGVWFVGTWDDREEIEAFIQRVGEVHEREEQKKEPPTEPAA